MIHIHASLCADGLAVVAVGHAGYGAWGRDIVCAGVSALLFGFVAYLEGLSSSATAEDGHGHMDRAEGDGWLWVRTNGMGGKDTEAWAVTAAGLGLLATVYPDCVKVTEHDERNGKET